MVVLVNEGSGERRGGGEEEGELKYPRVRMEDGEGRREEGGERGRRKREERGKKKRGRNLAALGVYSLAPLTLFPLTILDLCHHLGQWMVEGAQATIF